MESVYVHYTWPINYVVPESIHISVYMMQCLTPLWLRWTLGFMPRGWSMGQNLGTFLAHQSQRLIGELYSIPMLLCLSSVCPASTISNVFFSETACPIKAKFYVEPPLVGGTKVFVRSIWVTWPRWLPCPYMVKTLQKILLLRNQWTDFY